MNGYMGLFLETGDPAFYLMAKRDGSAASAASGGMESRTAYGAADSAADRLEDPTAEEETSPR